MRLYTFIFYIFIILHTVSVNIAAKYSYGRPSYNDRSLRGFEDQEGFETEYSNGSPRFRKYHSSYRYRPSRSGRHSIDYDRERAYYNSPGRENDPSIEVIVDPSQKKAVAVIENGPAGQSRYELTGYQAAGFETDAQAANQEQTSNLAAKSDRKRNPKIFDSNADVDSENYENENSKVDEQLMNPEKEKRSADPKKRKINKASKLTRAPVKQEYTDEQVSGIPTKRKSENKENNAENCPPHLEEQAKEEKLRNGEGINKDSAEKNHAKREVANAFSETQLNALSDSLSKVKDTSADMENLKHVLYDMGLVRNYQTIDKRDAQGNDEQFSVNENVDKQQTKRDLEQTEAEDEDMNKDNVIMKRDSEAGYEQPWMDEDDANFDEQMDKRDAESDNWDDEEMADEPMDKAENGKYESEASELNEAKMNDENAKEMEDADVPMRDKRQNEENMEKQENAEENQHEMIDNYEKELQQTNLKTEARDKREQDKNKMKDNEKRSDKNEQKRSDKEKDKLIKDTENQMAPENTNADDKKKVTKRENDAVQKRQENEETKKKMESEIKEKIQLIKEKVKREIMEENARGRNKNSNIQRNIRALDSLDLDGSFKRSKRDLSSSAKDDDDVNINMHDLKHYVLNRGVNTSGNVTHADQDLKRNQSISPETDAKALDPIIDSQNLKTYIRQHRQVNGTNETKIMETIPKETVKNTEQKIIPKDTVKNAKEIAKGNDTNSDDKAKELEPAVRKRRDIKDVQNKAILLEPEEKTIAREKRANGVPEKQMVYEPFQNGDVDETEEEGEFGDNYKDGRLYIDKRQAANEEEYFEEPQKRTNGLQYESEATYMNGENPERKRSLFEDEDNAGYRNGEAMRNGEDGREKRDNEEPLETNAKLTDEEEYSENLYFGPLSKTYNGELTRYKRVKRDKP